HVLGFGTLWDPNDLNLLVGPAAQGGVDPHFVGAQALAAFDAAGGTAYSGGAKVPVENQGGPGTADGHWRETVFGNELMTGYLNFGTNPLSAVTIASFGDEHYQVNDAAADIYTHSFFERAGPAPTLRLGADILRRPIYLMNATGKVTGVFRR
ncbi:MAG TPA: leishmanolysin-related zinc metalloendopeptidase, partial [Gemmatimonadales bacterium]|nr:leishmanolysin-related zinc metalloendopeptidase [Gemmatimonadales bacterium]